MDTNCAVQSEKTALNREFEHGIIAKHKKMLGLICGPLGDDDIAYDIVYDIVYDMLNHIVYYIVLIYDIV